MKNTNELKKLKLSIVEVLKGIKQMADFSRVKFIVLFGSYSSGKQNKLSDIDFAVYYDGNEDERYEFRKKMLGKFQDDFDIHIFQDLPLYVRINVLKGKLIYAKDLTFVYDKYYETIKEFERFKKYYYDYIGNRRLRI